MIANNGQELKDICLKEGISIWEYTLKAEAKKSKISEEEVFNKMKAVLEVMKASAKKGLNEKVISVSSLIGGDAYKLNEYSKKESLTGSFMNKAMARALSSSEVNAAMGKIVAAPTAGSCGIMPAVIISAAEKLNKNEDDMVRALLSASTIGNIISTNATVSGAEGGCQAECGSAAAMACAGIVEMMGGSVEQALDGAAIVIKNILGLVCDPVAGLVEIPCAKRNVAGTVSALTTADIVMAGITSHIPFDDTVEAMFEVGKSLPCALRETALGGVAITKAGKLLEEKVFGKKDTL
ncbi:MAG: L-serine ammonia-lyase, iron-sulfur-dependent, subunit alpha [Peptostreptococcaceae bacterium]|jgi:L-serine dehydratase|nr:L-serine ammonia-lyase, iron-sulfur-dependent, subunit alpha [Peptostreptococcaceae bacterium]